MTTNQEKIKDMNGVIRYYYTKVDGFKHKGKRATVCLVRVGEQIFKGITSCSPKDSFNKRIGRNGALGRAVSDIIHGRIYSTHSELNEWEKWLFTIKRGQ